MYTFASITNKLKKIAKIPYCCQWHLVYLKAQNILLKMAANFFEKGHINVDIGRKTSQSVSDNMKKRLNKWATGDFPGRLIYAIDTLMI